MNNRGKNQYANITPSQRFWDSVIKTNKCWECNLKGGGKYRQISVNGKNISVHRFSWELHNGVIPKGMLVCHKCDNPICVNPEHLFLGTHKDNTQDMIRKNRRKYSGVKVINDDILKKIKDYPQFTQRKIADILNISQSTVWKVRNGLINRIK